jgi:ABC-type nitrate/sulfonate/bicarbonate transport system substrate-binding protein
MNNPLSNKKTVLDANAIEKVQVTIGFMPLTDCAPLVVVKELGYFTRFGLDVTMSK